MCISFFYVDLEIFARVMALNDLGSSAEWGEGDICFSLLKQLTPNKYQFLASQQLAKGR